jgi:hypothetical protein
MPLTYDQVTELLLRSRGPVEIDVRDGKKVHCYKVRNYRAFLDRTDGRFHSHAVRVDGTLVYSRDVNGKVKVGTRALHVLAQRRQHPSRTARAGFLGTGARRGLRFWGQGGG